MNISKTDPTSYHPYIVPEYLSIKNELNWGRLICTWHEKQASGEILTHHYAACVDGKDGEIYPDCQPTKIFIKCLACLFVRPLHSILKTLYHLSLYPIFYEAIHSNRSTLRPEERATDPIGTLKISDNINQIKIKNIFKSIVDIFLTPLYGLILTITTIGVLIIGPLNPKYLYEGRKLLGKIEQMSNWGQTNTPMTLSKCFQPRPLEMLEHYGERETEDDTYYPDENPISQQLGEFAKACILYQRKHFDVFSCKKLQPKTCYQSPFLVRHFPS